MVGHEHVDANVVICKVQMTGNNLGLVQFVQEYLFGGLQFAHSILNCAVFKIFGNKLNGVAIKDDWTIGVVLLCQ